MNAKLYIPVPSFIPPRPSTLIPLVKRTLPPKPLPLPPPRKAEPRNKNLVKTVQHILHIMLALSILFLAFIIYKNSVSIYDLSTKNEILVLLLWCVLLSVALFYVKSIFSS